MPAKSPYFLAKCRTGRPCLSPVVRRTACACRLPSADRDASQRHSVTLTNVRIADAVCYIRSSDTTSGAVCTDIREFRARVLVMSGGTGGHGRAALSPHRHPKQRRPWPADAWLRRTPTMLRVVWALLDAIYATNVGVHSLVPGRGSPSLSVLSDRTSSYGLGTLASRFARRVALWRDRVNALCCD